MRRRAAAALAALAVLLPAPALAAAREPERVIGGGGFNDAAPIEPGTYEDTVAADQVLYYALSAPPDQPLDIRVSLPAGKELPGDLALSLQAFDDARQPLAEPVSTAFPGDAAAQLATTLEGGGLRSEELFLVLELVSSGAQPLATDDYDLRLEVLPAAEQPSATAAPAAANGRPAQAGPDAAAGGDPEEAIEPAASRPLLLTGALALLAVAGLWALLSGRRRRARRRRHT